MTEPNYAYCLEYCPGIIEGCPHYMPLGFHTCKHYYDLMKAEPKKNSKGLFSRSEIERIILKVKNKGE